LTNETLEVGSTEGIDSIGWLKMFVGQTTAIGKFLADAYPPGTSLATTAAGVIPYYSRMRTLDLLGLNDAYTAHEVPKGGGRPGHTVSAPEDYVLRWRPDLLIWHPRVSSGVPQTSPAEREYWRLRGYGFRFVRVSGMDPPDLTYFEIEPGGPGTPAQ
jgi:hypothetical protein